ncbi:MAG TPA: flagellar biosynthesis protein FliQ [Solirubrobacteraceae bacterium]|nr:flagellar biosynthesis protein FliQ [Solirubrobacteraceae bacterium]
MSSDTVVSLGTDAMTLALKIGLPILLAGLIVGLLISVFQAVTQIQEQTLTFIPKILATIAVIVIAGPWMLDQMVLYAHDLYGSIPEIAGPSN